MKIVDESILFFSRVSLGFLSRSSQYFVGMRGIYTYVCLECKESIFPKQSWLAAWPRDLTELRVQATN